MRRRDWPVVSAIYEEGIRTGQATFETAAPAWAEWNAAHLDAHRLVATSGNDILGWAALAPVSGRCVYAGVAEDSVYVSEPARGSGVGRALLEELLREADEAGIWTVEAGVFPENRASLRLHHSCGFRTVGLRERLGKLNGEWRDVLLLERRSEAVE